MALDLATFQALGAQLKAAHNFTATKVIGPQVKAGTLDSADLAEVAPLFSEFPDLVAGIQVTIGDVYNLNGVLIEIVQSHTTQQDWIDALTPSLYKRYHVDGADFRQPTGAHDVYKLGQIVTFEGALWRSKIDNNGYSPTGYPAGWEQV